MGNASSSEKEEWVVEGVVDDVESDKQSINYTVKFDESNEGEMVDSASLHGSIDATRRSSMSRSQYDDVHVVQNDKPVVGYLLHRSEILDQEEIPCFLHVRNIYPVTDWDEAPKYIFICHRYLSFGHCDDAYQTKLRVIQALLKTMKNVQYVWLDFSCVPADSQNRIGAFMNLTKVIVNALRILIIPFKSISISKAPVFDLLDFSTRAWCIFECSVVLARHPSKVRIAKISQEKGKTFSLEFMSLPTHDKDLGVQHLVASMKLVREILEKDHKADFLNTFVSTAETDRDIIWDLLKLQQQEIFQLAGVRRNSDFFVRTKFASTMSTSESARPAELYDRKTLREINSELCDSTGGCFRLCH